MQLKPSTVERAYELARTGEYAGINEIRAQLKAEGYADYMSQLEGAWIKSMLRKLWLQATRDATGAAAAIAAE
jgi:hypothetical protein